MKKLFFLIKTILPLILFFIAQDLYSQNLKIEGRGEDIGGKTIRVISIEDNLSLIEREIGRKTLGKEDTSFNFALTIPNTSTLIIRIEDYDYRFIAKMGGVYKMRILPFNYNVSDSVNTRYYKIPLSILIEHSNDDNLNERIYIIDSVVEDFIIENRKELLRFRDKTLIKVLKDRLDSLLIGNSSKYIEDYVYYTYSKIEYASRTKKEKQLKEELFFNKPILYDNVAYMDCFEIVYGNYFTDGNKSFSERTLERWLENNNYFALIDSLGIDTLLKNEVFRELVFLRGMKEAFFSNKFEKLFIITMLENFIYQTKFKEHQIIAHNLLELFAKKSMYGFKSKDFSLKDIYGNYITLDKYKGKPLILSFVKLNEPFCLRELAIMSKFVDTLSNGYNFLTITCDRSLDALYNFLVNSKIGVKYKWDFAHFDGSREILEDYNVIFFPKFILIDAKGTILQSPMLMPSEGGLLPFVPRDIIKKD